MNRPEPLSIVERFNTELVLTLADKKVGKDKPVSTRHKGDRLRQNSDKEFKELIDKLKDLTDDKKRKSRGERYKKELEKYKILVDSSHEGMFLIDSNLKIEMINKSLADRHNVKSEELIGESVEVFVEKGVITEENLEKGLKKAKTLFTDDRDSGSFKTTVNADGEKRYYEIIASTIETEEGEVEGLACVAHDITETERKKRLRESKMDEFSSLVSHDLRNPLNLAQGYLEIAKDSKSEDHYEVIEKAHNRMESIIDELIIITEDTKDIDRQRLNLEEVFEEAFYFAGEEDIEYEVEDITITGDRSGLISVLENLISNTIRHNDDAVTIEMGSLEEREGFYYEDDGKGIEKDKCEEVFDYGYSTSEEGRGLGLPIVKRIVEAHDWRIECKGSESDGARFEIYTS